MRRSAPEDLANVASASAATDLADRQGAPDRLDAVTGLRGVAFLMVFVFHCFLELNSGAGGVVGAIYSNAWNYFFPHHLGAMGVQLFFVVSGFCIHRSRLIWRRSNPEAPEAAWIKTYCGRRLYRIYPMYLVTLLALQVIERGPLQDLVWHAALVQNLVPDQINRINPSLWSLAVEAQLYALYPIWAWAMRRWPPLIVLGALILLSLAWRLGTPKHVWWANMPWRWGFEWFLGALVAETLPQPRWIGARTVLLGVVAALAILAPSRFDPLDAIIPPLLFAALLGRLVRDSASWPHWIVATGAVSYALYLVHQPVLTAVAWMSRVAGADMSEAGSFLTAGCLALAVSLVAAIPLERWGRRQHNRLAGSIPTPDIKSYKVR